MTTYTMSKALYELMLEAVDFHSDILDTLQALQPNTQETQAQRIEELEAKLRIAQMSTVEKCAEIYMLRQEQQPKPLTDAFAKAASEHGLTLVTTVDGYKLIKCGPATAHGVKP